MQQKEKEEFEINEFYRYGLDDFKSGVPMKDGIQRARKLHQREAYVRGYRDAFKGLIGEGKSNDAAD